MRLASIKNRPSSIAEVPVEMACEPSEALTQLVARGKLDLVLATSRDGEILRHEPVVRVASLAHGAHHAPLWHSLYSSRAVSAESSCSMPGMRSSGRIGSPIRARA